MSPIVLYFLHSTSVLSNYIDIVLTLSMEMVSSFSSYMMTLWHLNAFHITVTLWRESLVTGEFMSHRASNVDLSCYFFVVRLCILLNKQSNCQGLGMPETACAVTVMKSTWTTTDGLIIQENRHVSSNYKCPLHRYYNILQNNYKWT